MQQSDSNFIAVYCKKDLKTEVVFCTDFFTGWALVAHMGLGFPGCLGVRGVPTGFTPDVINIYKLRLCFSGNIITRTFSH